MWQLFLVSVSLLAIVPSLGVVGLVVTAGWVWRRDYREIFRYRFNWGLGLFLLWLVLISFFAFKPIQTLEGWANLLPLIAAFPAFTRLINSPARLRLLAWVIVLPSLLITVLGLGQLFAGWASPPLLQQLDLKLIADGQPAGRMSSLLMYANTLAAYLVIVFGLALGLLVDSWRTRPKDWRKVGLLSLISVLAAMGLLLTKSRSGWGIAFGICLVYCLYFGWRWIFLALAATGASIGWATWGPIAGRDSLRAIVPSVFWSRLSDDAFERPIETLRSTQWQFASEMIAHRPWFGWGLRNFTPLYKGHMGLWLGHPHNLFLMLLAEVGIPGTLLFCGLIGWVMLQASRLLFTQRPTLLQGEKNAETQSNRLVLFSFLVAFGGCIAFNNFDVTIFELRLNVLGWVVVSAIGGMVQAQQEFQQTSVPD